MSPLSYTVDSQCCGACKYSAPTSPCLCSGVDGTKETPVYVKCLARALDKVVQANDCQALQVATDLACFRGQRRPPISIHAYIERIAKYSKCSPVCFVMAWAYLKRISAKEHTELAVTSLTVHRLVICSVLLAVKMTDDRYFDNAFFAKIGGIDLSELNTMELKMLQLLDYRTHVSAAELRWLLSRLKTFEGAGQINSILCKKRSGATVDIPTAASSKHREVKFGAANSRAVCLRQPVSMTEARGSLASRSFSCRLCASSCPAAGSTGDMARSPSNGFCLPQFPLIPDVLRCTQQENSVIATGSMNVEVSA